MMDHDEAQGDRAGTGRRGRWRVWVGAALLVILGAVVLFSLLLARRLHATKVFLQRARSEAQTLNREFQFRPPPTGPVADDQWAAWLGARRLAQAAIGPDLARGVDELLTAPAMDRRRLGELYLRHEPALREAIERQLQILRAQRMSLDEYSWRMGWALRDALAAGGPEGANYREVLGQAQRLAGAMSGRGGDLDAARLAGLLEKEYAGYPPAPAAVTRELGGPSRAACALDLAAAAARWAMPQ